MFVPLKDLTVKLQDFFAEYLTAKTEERSEVPQEMEQSLAVPASLPSNSSGNTPTTGSDSPGFPSLSRPKDKSCWFPVEESVYIDRSPSFTSSMSETTEEALVQPLPLLTTAKRFRCERSSGGEQSLDGITATCTTAATVLNAARHNDVEACKSMLSPGNKTELKLIATDSEGRSALHWAALNGSLEICRLLVETQSDLTAKDKLGRTPLHCACLGEHISVAKFLISHGADVNSTDSDGNTPLHYAATVDNEELVLPLLTPHTNLRLRNYEGRVAMDPAGPQTVKRLTDSGKRHRDGVGKRSKKVVIKDFSQEEGDFLTGKTAITAGSDSLCVGKKSGPEDFELLHMLGKGSFGEVFLVRKRTEGKLFAMKVMKKELIVGQHLVKYAKTERNVLSYVRHPFIISLSSAFQTADRLFLILDYCPGGDMGYHLSKEKRFSEHRARIYACEILLAIEELHNRGIIFRDLKPENVVFDAMGHAVLTDFGLSKEGVGSISGATSFCGSLAYLAPEMIRRRGHGKAVDWYLFGVLLYEMLTGSPPYFCPNRDQLLRNILYGRLPMPDYLSEEAKSLVSEVRNRQLIERNPAERLGSGPLGAEEIKQHSFFRGVLWSTVFQRELRPPVLQKPLSSEAKVGTEKMFGSNAVVDPVMHVEGWSFD